MVSIFLAEIQCARSHFPTSRVFTYQRVPPREIPPPICCQHHRSSTGVWSGSYSSRRWGQSRIICYPEPQSKRRSAMESYMSEARQRDFRGCLDVFWFTNILVMENCHPDNQGVECMLINASPLLNNRPHHDQRVQGNTCIYTTHTAGAKKRPARGKEWEGKECGGKVWEENIQSHNICWGL